MSFAPLIVNCQKLMVDSPLPLFVLGGFAQYHNPALTPRYFTIFTNFFHGSAYFHFYND